MNILITGGTGFLGFHLAKQFLKYHNVKVIARGVTTGYLTELEKKAFNFVPCDIIDKDSLKNVLSSEIDLIVHCAGVVKIQSDGRCSDNLAETNLNLTINLIEAMVDKGIKNLAFSSSMTVYGIENDIPVKENSVLDPIHFYGLSKKWSEETIISYARRGLINALILRYPGLYGYPRKDGYIYNVTRKLLNNEDVTINTKGLRFWETINVEDAAEITKKVLEPWKWNKKYEIMNCSYGEEIDFVATAFKIKEIINSNSTIEIKKPLDYTRFYMDNSKIRNLMKDFNYNFEKSLKVFLTNYKSWLQE